MNSFWKKEEVWIGFGFQSIFLKILPLTQQTVNVKYKWPGDRQLF